MNNSKKCLHVETSRLLLISTIVNLILANPKLFLCRTKSAVFSRFCRTIPQPENHYVYTINFVVLYKMQDTNFAGHLAEFAAKKQDGC